MFRCRCHTCDETEFRETLEDAQRFFNDHADREHEVEFVRAEEARSPAEPEGEADED